MKYVLSPYYRRLVKIERHWDSTIENLEAKAAESVGALKISHREQRRALAKVSARAHNCKGCGIVYVYVTRKTRR